MDFNCPNGLHVTELEFDKSFLLTVRYCQSHAGGNSYWYVCKYMSPFDRPFHVPRSCDIWYWTAEGGWDWQKPKQYGSPQEAYDDVKDKI